MATFCLVAEDQKPQDSDVISDDGAALITFYFHPPSPNVFEGFYNIRYSKCAKIRRIHFQNHAPSPLKDILLCKPPAHRHNPGPQEKHQTHHIARPSKGN